MPAMCDSFVSRTAVVFAVLVGVITLLLLLLAPAAVDAADAAPVVGPNHPLTLPLLPPQLLLLHRCCGRCRRARLCFFASCWSQPSSSAAATAAAHATFRGRCAAENPGAPPTSAAPYADSDGGAGHSCNADGEAGSGAQSGGGGEAGARDPGLNQSAAAAGQEEEVAGMEGLEGMSAGALVASFRRAQEERVALYRKFNG